MEEGEIDFSKLMENMDNSLENNQLPIITVVYYWAEILRAVKYIHENGKFI
jgi:serine/threonine protein kinase